MDRENPLLFELKAWIPFSSERKVMTVAYVDRNSDSNTVKVIMKGAPENVIEHC